MAMRSFRKHQKYILAVLAAALMVVWGMGSAFRNRGPGGQDIGKILDEPVSVADYQAEGGRLQVVDPALKDTRDDRAAPWLIWRTMVLSRLAKRDGVRISDEEVKRELERRFTDRAGYEKELGRYNLELGRTDLRYEEPLRQYMLANKYQMLMQSAVPVTRAEVREQFLRQLDEAQVSFVTVPVTMFQADAIADTDTHKAFYEKRVLEGKYATPERIRVRYILSSYADLMKEAEGKITDADIALHY